jgi:hypothetical protein
MVEDDEALVHTIRRHSSLMHVGAAMSDEQIRTLIEAKEQAAPTE